jgi:hypothetical protein
MQNRTVRIGQAEQGRQNRTGRMGQADQDRIYMYIPEQDRQNGRGRLGQADRTGRTGEKKWDTQNRSAEEDIKNGTDRTG